ncbi:cation diffusion facilitator family transporter [Candidatus Tisiphia endosymbiont of Myopa tessellatipennis]|uniref:cation diffusion facilitator family transporter n=1 Tax=Candidatus Tisiphia endosymbiont of Myopa tessellatipennis TaxID=3066257 RepID=UPI00313A780C
MTNSEHQILIKSSSYLSFSIAVFILFIKSYAWLVTDSQSILASLIDTMLDISSSLINLIAIRFSLQPPDYHHRFGHEKIQDLAIFSQAVFFVVSGLFMGFSSLRSLIDGSVPSNIEFGINVLYLCIILTFILVAYQTYVIKKTGSEIIKVDKLHYFTDLLTNVGVIVSIKLSTHFWFIDSLFGIGIAIYIIYASYALFRKAFKNLIDEEMPEEDRKKILSIITRFKEVKGIHEMKTRYAASKPFIQCHIEMDGDMSLYSSHYISDKIYIALLLEFPSAEIIIHLDPYGYEEKVNYRENINQI